MLFFLVCTHRHTDLNIFVWGHMGNCGAALPRQLSLEILSPNHIIKVESQIPKLQGFQSSKKEDGDQKQESIVLAFLSFLQQNLY